MKFSHTMIRVKDIEKSLRFYTDVMGLKLVRTMELPAATLYFLTDDVGCCSIELTYNHELPEGGYSHGNYFGHLAFDTESIDEFTEKLTKFGMDYKRPPFNIKPEGPRIAFLEDPDGFAIEIIERK